MRYTSKRTRVILIPQYVKRESLFFFLDYNQMRYNSAADHSARAIRALRRIAAESTTRVVVVC